MTYTPQAGDIGLVQIHGQVGMAIRIGQYILAKIDDHRASGDEDWADYQHAFVYLGDGQLIEAEPGGARIRDLSEYDGVQIYWCENISRGLTDEQRQDIAAAARTMEGDPYSFIDYFALTAHQLHIWVPFLRRYVALTHHVICSQLAAWAYKMATGDAIFKTWPGYVDPLDIYLLDKSLSG